ncbi:MAG: hypothetical protein PHU25_20640 [Deltaproteobacteria bacterium]|nr:hypothetical protein [Deltaproteobacteria bacterium]
MGSKKKRRAPTGPRVVPQPEPAAWDPRREKAAVWGFGALLALATSLPYLIAWASAAPGEVFTGIAFNSTDTNQYLAWIRDGARGEVIFTNRYTPEPTPPAFFVPFFLVLGWISRLTGLPAVAVFHGARVLLVPALVRVVHWFSGLFLASTRDRFLATGLAVTMGGLGLPLHALGVSFGDKLMEMPIDFWVPEAFVFQTLYTYPHLVLATALMLLAIGHAKQALAASARRRVALSWASAFGLALVHPFDLVPVYAVMIAFGAMALAREPVAWKRIVATLAIIGIASAPPAIAQLALLESSPGLEGFFAQNRQTVLGAAQFALGMGLPLLAAPVLLLFGLAARRGSSGAIAQPLAHLCLVLALVFLSSFDLRRRFLMGIDVPLAIVLAWSLRACLDALRANGRAAAGAAFAFILLCAPGSALKMAHDHETQLAADAKPRARYYHTGPQRDLYAFLGEKSTAADVTLTDPITGNELPAYADTRVFVGHWAYTRDYRDKVREWNALKDPASGAAMLGNLVTRHGITFVALVRARDRESRLEALLRGRPDLEPVFENAAGVIFRVTFKP